MNSFHSNRKPVFGLFCKFNVLANNEHANRTIWLCIDNVHQGKYETCRQKVVQFMTGDRYATSTIQVTYDQKKQLICVLFASHWCISYSGQHRNSVESNKFERITSIVHFYVCYFTIRYWMGPHDLMQFNGIFNNRQLTRQIPLNHINTYMHRPINWRTETTLTGEQLTLTFFQAIIFTGCAAWSGIVASRAMLYCRP